MSSNTGAAQIIIFFAISLFFSSLAISWFLFQAYGVNLSPIPMELFYSDNAIDFKSGDGSGNGNLYLVGGNWNYNTGVGRVADAENAYLLFNNAGASNAGAHTNTYRINNTNQRDYSIVLSYSGVRVQKVVVAQDGFHVLDDIPIASWFGSHEVYFFPYANANKLTNVEIKTVFDVTEDTIADSDSQALYFYLNGNLLFTTGNVYGMQIEPITKAYYGGIGSENNIGLTVESFNTVAKAEASQITDIAAMGLSYLGTIAQIIIWNVPAQFFPWELNFLLIKSQAFAIGVGIWFWIRG